MKALLAAVLVGMWAATSQIAESQSGEVAKQDAARFKAAQAELEKDVRLAKLTDSPPQQMGILAYYPNKGGGYTFVQGKEIVFYALPYTPSTYQCEVRVRQRVNLARAGGNPHTGGVTMMADVTQSINVPTIGPSRVPFGGQTVYRTEMSKNGKGGFVREDIRLAYWSRETSGGKFQLWILADDRETRMKLKSIVAALEGRVP
ncbi:MAG TPA: hypothetical protein VGP63_05815 [Planctomycetaceae bacterium]|jgi:hypothetical protein|nr:hypothetical protein [Planctomycetaceae bacterium]